MLEQHFGDNIHSWQWWQWWHRRYAIRHREDSLGYGAIDLSLNALHLDKIRSPPYKSMLCCNFSLCTRLSYSSIAVINA